MRRRGVAIAVSLVPLTLAAGAFADSKMGLSGGTVTFRSEDAGISNDLTVGYDAQHRIRFFDDTDPYGMSGYPSPPCSPGKLNGQGNAIEVFCDRGGVQAVDIDIGPGQDDVVYKLSDRPVTLSGNLGADLLASAGAADVIRGGQGNDTIDSAGGADDVSGGDGKDSLRAGDGNDKIDGGYGGDAIDAGAGDDTLQTADGYGDSVDCGPGADTIVGDQLDQLSGCESVTRQDVAPPADQPPEDDAIAPTLRARVSKRQRVSGRRRRVVVSVEASEPALVNVSGFLDAGGVNHRLKSPPPAVNLGEGGTRIVVPLTKGQIAVALRDLARGRTPRVRLTLSAVDPAGNTSKPRHLKIALKK